jgi:putative inorganic carbon (HCO3(-)) transporter
LVLRRANTDLRPPYRNVVSIARTVVAGCYRPAMEFITSPRREPLGAATTVLLVSASVVLTTWTATSADSRLALVVPLAAAAGLVLGVLALTRFTTFVQVLLVIRASLDLAKVSGEAAENDLSARAFDPSSQFAVLFLVTAALWLAAQHRSRGRLPGSALRRALAMFAAAGLLSIVGTSDYGATSLELVRILGAVMMFVVLEQIMLEPGKMRAMLRAVYLSAAFPLAFTLVDILSGSPRSEIKGSFMRLLGPFNQSNSFARYLMLLIIFGAAIYPRLDRTHRRILAVLLGVASVFLLLTYTRSALVATVLGLVVVGLLQDKRLLVGLLIALVSLVVVNPTLGARFTELGGSDSILATNSRNTLQWRFEQWADVLKLSRGNLITGIGLATTQRVTENEKQPHNDFVRTYVEMGIVGFLTYVAVVVAVLRLGWSAVKTSPTASFEQSVGIGFLGCGVAFIAVSFVANVISNVVILWYFLTFAAAASAVVLWNVKSSDHQRAARASAGGAVI